MSTRDSYTVKNDYGEFVVEDDSIDVVYNFYGHNAPITVGVVNKMSKPLYVDWTKSGIMIDDTPTSYIEPSRVSKGDDSQLVDFTYFLSN